MQMPEEINQILTDQMSDLLFCPTDTAMEKIRNEGFEHKPVRFFKVGDVMQDVAIFFTPHAVRPQDIEIKAPFISANQHWAENTDNPSCLAAIISSLNVLHRDVAPVVLPIHPRTRGAISKAGMELNVSVFDPVVHLEMFWLLDACGLVLTDSGGVKKEISFFGKASVTMRDQTEWVELIHIGTNELAGTDTNAIVRAGRTHFGRIVEDGGHLYGGGQASKKITDILMGFRS